MERRRSFKKYISIAILLGIMVMMILAFSVKSWQNRNGKLNIVCILKIIDDSDFWTSLYTGGPGGCEGVQCGADGHGALL